MESSHIIFFLIPVLLIGVLSNTAFAEVEKGVNYDKEIIGINPDGTIKTKATLYQYDRIFDGTQYQDYIFTDFANSLQVETNTASVTLDKTTCGFSFHNKGFINQNPTPLFTDSITPYVKVQGDNPWGVITQIDAALCNASWNGSELTATKTVPGIGTIQYKYILNGGVWKTQLEATNLTGLTDRVFGFDQTIDLNRDTVFYGGNMRNLDNYHDTTFDRTWLENNQGKIIEFLNGYYFDFDLGFDYLDSITIQDTGIDSSKLTFHYMRNDEVLLPGITLIIDPTYGPTAGTMQEVYKGSSCTGGATKITANEVGYASGASQCFKQVIYWDISTIDDDATIDSITWDFTNGVPTGSISCEAVPFSLNNVAALTADQIFNEIGVGGSGGEFQEVTECGTASGAKSITMVSAAISDLESELGVDDEWAFGVRRTTSDTTAGYVSLGATQNLTVTYTTILPPDAVDDLASPSQSYGSVDLSWTQPGLNAGNVSGYQINYTTPWGNPLTTITNNTGLTDTSATVSNLNIGTQYTFGVSVWTEGGNNATKPPMAWLNVTTQGNFTIGNTLFNQTNTQVLPITFEEQSINSTAKFLNVTFANTYTMACDFAYKFAMTNQTYNNLTSYAVSTTLNETAFIFNNFENEIINVNCYDTITGTDADYLLIQSDFPLLQQIASFRDGTYGTEGKIGVFDFITIAVVIFSMIGLNRVNESVGAIFNTVLLGALAYFGIIELPTVIFGFMAVVLVFVITSTRKPG